MQTMTGSKISQVLRERVRKQARVVAGKERINQRKLLVEYGGFAPDEVAFMNDADVLLAVQGWKQLFNRAGGW